MAESTRKIPGSSAGRPAACCLLTGWWCHHTPKWTRMSMWREWSGTARISSLLRCLIGDRAWYCWMRCWNRTGQLHVCQLLDVSANCMDGRLSSSGYNDANLSWLKDLATSGDHMIAWTLRCELSEIVATAIDRMPSSFLDRARRRLRCWWCWYPRWYSQRALSSTSCRWHWAIRSLSHLQACLRCAEVWGRLVLLSPDDPSGNVCKARCTSSGPNQILDV